MCAVDLLQVVLSHSLFLTNLAVVTFFFVNPNREEKNKEKGEENETK